MDAGPDPAELRAQYATLTEACGLVDRSQRGKLALTGAEMVEFLEGQVTNELAGIAPGEGRYAAFLTHKGKMLGDLRILAVGGDSQDTAAEAPEQLLLDTERAALQALFDMITRFRLGYDVRLEKRTLQSSLLSLIGPRARELACAATGLEELPAVEHEHVAARLAGRPLRLIVTAQPGGVDVLCDAEDHAAVVEGLVGAGAQPVSEAASEILRVEHGRPRYGVDLDESVIPQEAGLNERAVSFTKGCYVGQETVARLHYKGKPNRHLRGLRLSQALCDGAELRTGERLAGVLSSSVLSPVLGPIGLALLRREAEPGMTLEAGDARASATVLELPFTAQAA